MAEKKQRSVFWVVSTHVVTTGFALPAVAGIIGYTLMNDLRPAPLRTILTLLCLQALGYIGGVFYSLSYIRKTSRIDHPMACIKPSIIAFVVLAVVGFCVNAGRLIYQQHGVNPVDDVVVLVVFYTVICLVFARATERGFSRMEPSTTES